MKATLDLRLVYQHLERRIRAQVVLCWLALLSMGLAETATGHTWRNLRHQLDRMHLGTFTGDLGTVRRRTAALPRTGRHPAGPRAPRATQFAELTPPPACHPGRA